MERKEKREKERGEMNKMREKEKVEMEKMLEKRQIEMDKRKEKEKGGEGKVRKTKRNYKKGGGRKNRERGEKTVR